MQRFNKEEWTRGHIIKKKKKKNCSFNSTRAEKGGEPGGSEAHSWQCRVKKVVVRGGIDWDVTDDLCKTTKVEGQQSLLPLG